MYICILNNLSDALLDYDIKYNLYISIFIISIINRIFYSIFEYL